ncbi:hypothetical protein Aph01nite_69930 [Acrocarpospora phusangensis]|uniref:Uncharacterized protein n=1 Tax=Acrocarpospora phusangensis TaxID=1070424 RepID=A0A919USI3_9ACTN|nr:hypothetical protein [Acrocarpospora phusangensis]GIH28683.1 hypothetical protein Aph01nite_69930 [Acrocarpospora phusangensis]
MTGYHAVAGGTPAYRKEFVRSDIPDGPADFDDWVIRSVLKAEVPLFREARYLLAEETEIRDPSLYHSVLAAVADGNTTSGGIVLTCYSGAGFTQELATKPEYDVRLITIDDLYA